MTKPTDELLLAIDCGTQSVRALAIDLTGNIVAKTQCAFDDYLAPSENWLEHDACSFWSAAASVCRRLINDHGELKSRIKGVVVTTQRASLALFDASGRPLRPFIIWLDQRRATQIPKVAWPWRVIFNVSGTAGIIREARRARLEGSVLQWEHADVLPAELRDAIPAAPLAFVSVVRPASGTAGPAGHRSIRRSVRCGPIGRPERLRLWSSLAATPAPTAVAEWALRPGEICVAGHAAQAGDHEVSEVCRRLLMADTPELLTPLPLPFTWSDLVLSPVTAVRLREFEAQAADRGQVLDDWCFSRLTPLGRGTTALFAGPSGTGKTMATQVLARSLGLDLYRVDLAGLMSKYIGETEQHLRQVFEACERAPVLMLFDEADALFGKRTQVSDAHDRYANIEIDYLLQRMEQFDGVAVLATNRKGDLDTAFVRRLRFIIDFAPPDASEREQLWRLALEGASDVRGQPLVGDLDWHGLGLELDLTGAGIKSAALAAAFLARTEGSLICERHVRAAARRELEKQGVVVRPGRREPR